MFSKKMFSAQKASQAFWARRAREIEDELSYCEEILGIGPFDWEPGRDAEDLYNAEMDYRRLRNQLRQILPNLAKPLAQFFYHRFCA